MIRRRGLSQTEQSYRELLHILAALDDPERVRRVLEDLLTPKERDNIAERWAIIKLLHQGLTQREVRDRLKVSVTTVTRGSRQLQHGNGGFDLALGMLESLEKTS